MNEISENFKFRRSYTVIIHHKNDKFFYEYEYEYNIFFYIKCI